MLRVKGRCKNGKIITLSVSEQSEDGNFQAVILDNNNKKTDGVLIYNTEGDCLTEGKEELSIVEFF